VWLFFWVYKPVTEVIMNSIFCVYVLKF
jgi:hypothetical protein